MKGYSYILLICTWLLVAVSIVYFWVKNGSEPPVALWVVLGIIALIPLAERLKIGDWIDFTRKMGKLNKEIADTQKEVREVNNRLNTWMASVQSQQQFNIGLQGEEAARVLADYISSARKVSYPPSLEEITSSDEDEFFSKKMSPTDKQRFYFVETADKAIAQADPIIRIFYFAKVAKQEHKTPDAEQILDKEMTAVLQELQDDWKHIFAIASDKVERYLESIKTLIRFREEVYEGKREPPSTEEGQKLIQDAYDAIGYFSGMISAGYAVWFAPWILKDTEKRE
jgi:hypothetical protein